jgi:tRNA threonylcarbamoyladenosine biosynthesis protein TsaB
MRILAIDTATSGCSLALTDDGKVLAVHREEMSRGQAEHLLPMIGALTTEAGVPLDSIDLFAATTGPGAFTGIRIALAAARGLALALGKPGIGIGCFDVFDRMADADAANARLLAVESKRAEIYLELRHDGRQEQAMLEPVAIAGWLQAQAPGTSVILAGDAAERVAQTLPPELCSRCLQALPDPVAIAELAAARQEQVEQYPLSPVYMRPADAKPARPSRIWLTAP